MGVAVEYLKIEQIEYITLITINRQSALNALNVELLHELENIINSINVSQTRCVIITGAGEKAFVAGADIAYLKSLTCKQAEEFSLMGNHVFYLLEKLPIPVIAAVNGYALGGGCELACACDIRLASENAIFSQPEVGLGIMPGFGGTFRLAKLIGQGLAKEYLFTGERITANKALSICLVNAVYPQQELVPNAIEMAKKICLHSPIGINSIKQVFFHNQNEYILQKINIEAQYFGNCFTTEDQIEAMSAMLEKRKPRPFHGK